MGRIRARSLTARLPNPPVRPVRETCASYGSRDRDLYGDGPCARIPPRSWWTACAFPGYLCTVFLPYPSGPAPCPRLARVRTPRPPVTACRASEGLDRLSPPSFHPPSHPWQALPWSPQRPQARRWRWRVLGLSLPRSAAPQAEAGAGRVPCLRLGDPRENGVPRLRLSRIPPSIAVDWRTAQAREARGPVSRRTRPASYAAPWRLSATHVYFR